jgi:ABC-type glutathione transport system ATPase component
LDRFEKKTASFPATIQSRYLHLDKTIPAAITVFGFGLRERIDRWLAQLKLPEWKQKKTRELSKGMQQKIQFISAVLHDPDLLILDEPFSGLDPVNVDLLTDVVLELKRTGKTIIFSTHQMNIAEKICDDICLLNRSQKVLEGSIREVKKRLPQVLQQKSETTFAQQIRTLSEALQGEQGLRFAKFVQAHYPLILVDEFQDTNQDQDDILARVWRDATRYSQSCMIMVGDPKQAIYGFRRGDMLTYNKARADVLSKQGQEYSLRHNHRSVKVLVEAVDALFQRQMDLAKR